MKQINLLHEFFNESSDSNEFLEASNQEALEDVFESWLLDKLSDFDFASRFLIKHLAENHHPHVKCIIDSTSSELFEGQKRFVTNDFLVD